MDCRVTIELLDTESDDTEKSVSYAQEWSTYVERYASQGTPGQNNGPGPGTSGRSGGLGYTENKGVSSSLGLATIDDGSKPSSKTISNIHVGREGNVGEGSQGGKELGKKTKGHGSEMTSSIANRDNADAVSYSRSDASSSQSSGALSSATGVAISAPSTNISKSLISGCGQVDDVSKKKVDVVGKSARNESLEISSGIIRTVGGGYIGNREMDGDFLGGRDKCPNRANIQEPIGTTLTEFNDGESVNLDKVKMEK